MTISFDALEDDCGVRVRDASEGEQFPLYTDRPVDPTPAATADFAMPVDAAVAVDARELRLAVYGDAVFWRDGEVVHHADGPETAEWLARDTYEVGLTQPGSKLYVRVRDAAVTARFDDGRTALEADRRTRFVLGVRSHHETPAGTVTVSEDPRDVMAGVSAFGSALKTLSPDRSWPTLRGHPPALEFGDGLDVPEAVEPPETGVTLEVPPEYGPIFTVAPLAFYLGASVEPGTEPRLLAADAVHEFDAAGLAAGVRDALEHVFTLDCVVRAAGLHPFRTATADDLDERVDLDYEALFEVPLAERTAAYLEVPRSATAGLLDWHYTADVAPEPRYAPALPYLADDLALVRSPPPAPEPVTLSPRPDALTDADAAVARSTAASTSPVEVVDPADADTPGHSWVGPGDAVRAANPTVGSYRRALEYPEDGDGPLDVHVVYNDARLDGSDESAYDTHPYQETEVTTWRNLGTAELREVLYDDADFLHFVGHVTEAGMVCRDGVLDARTLARTGVAAFFLNGCRSYEQGRALLTAGAVGGVVTVDDVADVNACQVGRTVATLLDAGYSLYATLETLERTGLDAERYTVLGDGRFAARKTVSSSPILFEFETAKIDPDADRLPLSIYRYPSEQNSVGAVTTYTYIDAASRVQSASVTETTVEWAELAAYLDDSGIPTLLDGDIRLTDDLSVADFR
ncbi:hypothetical protein [Halobacterium yunchengense]|uniref:hypothetical protein n=1 Tax=Halobacterium yunchengense TaxID=3108497 RepID=UPI00300B73EF